MATNNYIEIGGTTTLGINQLTGDVTAGPGNGAVAATLASSISGAKTFSTSVLSPIFSTSAANPASTGTIRLSNTQTVAWRNAGNSANITISVDGSDILQLPTTTISTALSLASIATTTGAQTATLTNSPTAGNPTGFVTVKINGVTSYIPYWQ